MLSLNVKEHLVDALNNTIEMQRWSSMTGVGIPLPEQFNSSELLLRLKCFQEGCAQHQ